MPRPYFQTEGVACFAHRGGAGCWPENTLASFRGGLSTGCAWIETDVHMTRDGHIVCFHDQTLDRTTDGRGPIRDRSLAELRRLDAGYRFTTDGHSFPFRARGVTIPTLEEVAALDGAARLNLEIKQAEPSMLGPLLRAIEDLGIQDRVLVAGASAPVIRAFRRLARGAVPTSAGRAEILAFVAAARTQTTSLLAIEYDALQVPHHYFGLTVVDAAFVKAAHKRGLAVHVWTIDDVDEMRALLDLGVDGLMTDQPARLVQLVRERGQLPAVGLGSHTPPSPAAP